MDTIATYEFYDSQFVPTMSEDDFTRYARRATAYIQNNTDLPEEPNEDLRFMMQLCCCEMAEVLQSHHGRTLVSVSSDGYSENYQVTSSETELSELLDDYLGDYSTERVIFI